MRLPGRSRRHQARASHPRPSPTAGHPTCYPGKPARPNAGIRWEARSALWGGRAAPGDAGRCDRKPRAMRRRSCACASHPRVAGCGASRARSGQRARSCNDMWLSRFGSEENSRSAQKQRRVEKDKYVTRSYFGTRSYRKPPLPPGRSQNQPRTGGHTRTSHKRTHERRHESSQPDPRWGAMGPTQEHSALNRSGCASEWRRAGAP